MFSLPPEMHQKYLQRRFEEVELLKQSLNDNSVKEFNKFGHQIMGSAKNYGFVSLEPIALKMEQLSLSELQGKGHLLVEEFSLWLKANS